MFRGRICGRLSAVALAVTLVAGCDSEPVKPPSPSLKDTTGFWEIVPPSTLNYLPGTITTVEFTEDRKVRLHPTCVLEEKDAEYVRSKINPAKTTDIVWRDFNNFRSDLVLELEDYLSAAFGTGRIREESVSLQKMVMYVAPDEIVREIKERTLTGNCQDTVLELIKHKEKVCQTRAIIQGDISFELASTDDLSPEMKNQVEQVATALGFEKTSESERKFAGQGMYFGVKLFPYALFAYTKDAESVECKPD